MSQEEVNAVIIHQTGDAEICYIAPTLEAIAPIIGGHLEAIVPRLSAAFGKWHAYVDGDGLYTQPPNAAGTRFAHLIGWDRRESADGWLHGPVVFLGSGGTGEDAGAEEADVPTEVVTAVLAFYREHGEVHMD